jgi:hypothetical protein
LSNNALECSITIRVALAIKLAELATARKNHGLTNYSNDICRIGRYVQKNRALAQTRQTWFGNDQAAQ